MSKTNSLLAILASAGIIYAGAVTPDLVAFAGAIQKRDPVALFDFVERYPDSAFVPDAIVLASARGTGNNSRFLQAPGNTGPGNQGNNKSSGWAGGTSV